MNETPETIANLQGCDAERVPNLKTDPSRPAERWFLAIRTGDTPANSTVCALTVQYVEWWLSSESDAP